MKKLLLLVIDACSFRVLEPAMEAGRLPNLTALRQASTYYEPCCSIFPSITHAATASIATGTYPSEHGIAGAYWYSASANEVIYYSSDFWVIMNRGIGEFFEDFVVKFNHRWLQAETLFQTVEQAGLRAACINHIIFRGDVRHELDVPRLLGLIPGVPFSEEVLGPSLLSLGDLVRAIPQISHEDYEAIGGLLHRYGFEDDYTITLLTQMAQNHILPDFTLAYFPDNDDVSHQKGPEAAIETIIHLDEKLGSLFEVYGGLEPMLEELCVILTGDHAQSDILTNETEAGIQLADLLVDFSVAEAGQPWGPEDELMACPNLRSAQIYVKNLGSERLTHIVDELLSDSRIDQVMWRAEFLDGEKSGYQIAAADRGRLHFWPGDDGPHTAVDQHHNPWSWDGALSVVGGQVSADNVLTFSDYPNAFERIVGALECQSGGHIWATARPGHEFYTPGISVHTGGGSHGSLHVLDSIAPLLVAGAPKEIELPPRPRIIDIKPLCLSILGIA